MEKSKNAIVFAGGGSKGAYQIGAWKALNELGEQFQIATGTSIGSINAAFYVQGDFDAARKMWGEVTADSIMQNGINIDVSFESIFSQRDNLVPFVKNFINTKKVDITPFHNMMQRYFDPDKFFSSQIDFALMTVHYNGLAMTDLVPREVTKNEMQPKGFDAWKWIAASCACFPVFPPMEVDGENYIDGGFYDNIPVASAIKLGAKKVVVVDLKTENNHEGYIHHPNVTYIKPSKDLGGFLNFDRTVLERSMRLGFNDTMKVYEKYLGKIYTFIPDETSEELLCRISDIFVSILTESEAVFDFSSKVRFQRINKIEGCTSVLSAYIEKSRPTKNDLFIGALEMYLKAISVDDEKEYSFSELLYSLKSEVDRIYPLLEFDYTSAFSKAKEFIKTFSKGKSLEIKRSDEDRIMLILVSLMRALQRVIIK